MNRMVGEKTKPDWIASIDLCCGYGSRGILVVQFMKKRLESDSRNSESELKGCCFDPKVERLKV